MNDEQRKRLAELESVVIDCAMIDCDPRNWSDYGVLPKDKTREQRGDGKYDREVANKTMSLLTRIISITEFHDKPNSNGATKDPEQIDKMIDAATAKAMERAEKLGLDSVKH